MYINFVEQKNYKNNNVSVLYQLCSLCMVTIAVDNVNDNQMQAK